MSSRYRKCPPLNMLYCFRGTGTYFKLGGPLGESGGMKNLQGKIKYISLIKTSSLMSWNLELIFYLVYVERNFLRINNLPIHSKEHLVYCVSMFVWIRH